MQHFIKSQSQAVVSEETCQGSGGAAGGGQERLS